MKRKNTIIYLTENDNGTYNYFVGGNSKNSFNDLEFSNAKEKAEKYMNKNSGYGDVILEKKDGSREVIYHKD